MKIFICEQDVAKAKFMQAILGVYNYKVVTVEKHTDLLRNLNHQKPAVIIINQKFSKNSGLDTVARLREDPETSRIPIIYIGSDCEDMQLNELKMANLIEFVEEPVRIKNLRHYIDRWTTFRSLYMRH